jgi:hypothetical protein
MITSALTGAALAFYMDPISGRRRRMYVRDAAVRTWHETRHFAIRAGADGLQRARGLFVEAFGRDRLTPVDDEILRERVRAQLGHLVSHPRSIDVFVEHGKVTLRGHVLKSEVSHLCDGVAKVRGVGAVDNALFTHDVAEHLPELQGAHALLGHRLSPSLVAVLALGGGIAMISALRAPLIPAIAIAFGAVSVGRALLHEPMGHLDVRGASTTPMQQHVH